MKNAALFFLFFRVFPCIKLPPRGPAGFIMFSVNTCIYKKNKKIQPVRINQA